MLVVLAYSRGEQMVVGMSPQAGHSYRSIAAPVPRDVYVHSDVQMLSAEDLEVLAEFVGLAVEGQKLSAEREGGLELAEVGEASCRLEVHTE